MPVNFNQAELQSAAQRVSESENPFSVLQRQFMAVAIHGR